MQPFKSHTGLAAVLDRVNVDTDQIIPKQFLKRIERTGFGEFLFYDWRYEDDGKTPRPDFPLNASRYQGASVLVAGDNFGCGSSREHAPWALMQYGFQVVIAPSFADIFFGNCFQNGLLPIRLPQATVEDLMRKIEANPGATVTVDLAAQTVTGPGGFQASFEVDPFRKNCMLNGLDDVGMILQRDAEIAAFEAKLPAWRQAAVK